MHKTHPYTVALLREYICRHILSVCNPTVSLRGVSSSTLTIYTKCDSAYAKRSFRDTHAKRSIRCWCKVRLSQVHTHRAVASNIVSENKRSKCTNHHHVSIDEYHCCSSLFFSLSSIMIIITRSTTILSIVEFGTE